MKYVIFTILALLIIASLGTYWSLPESQTQVPIMYWVTDPNPARVEQIALFQRWMKKNGYPECELRTDTANNQPQKKIIQAVSGVAGDIIDLGGNQMNYFRSMGVLEDVTSAALAMGFDPSKTYPALKPYLVSNGRQYLFPCNVGVSLLYVNVDAFRRAGMEAPPKTWNFAEFERFGKEYVARANAGQSRQTYFLHTRIKPGFIRIMRRSLGLAQFNETCTRSILDDERNARVFELARKWTNDDHVFATAADEASFSVDTGYGGVETQLFHAGNYATMMIGRWVLIQMRLMTPRRQLSASHYPCDEFDNVMIATRAAAIYKGGRNVALAECFPAFLASEEYNMHIVRDSDALPPIPKFAENEEFLHPPEWPNEWDCHRIELEAAQTISIVGEESPFVLDTVASRFDQEALDKVISGLYTPREAATELARKVNDEMARMLREDPRLRPLYDDLCERQKAIEQLRRDGKKVPLAMVTNCFYQRYYQWKGWGE